MRGASAAATEAVISSRSGSTRRRIGSVAIACVRSPGLCSRCAMMPANGARIIARAMDASALARADSARVTSACASATSLSAFSISRREMIPRSARSRDRDCVTRAFSSSRLRACDLGSLPRYLGVGRWHREAHEQISTGDAVALGVRDLEDACRFRRRGDELGSRGRRDDARRANDRSETSTLRRLGGDGCDRDLSLDTRVGASLFTAARHDGEQRAERSGQRARGESEPSSKFKVGGPNFPI